MPSCALLPLCPWLHDESSLKNHTPSSSIITFLLSFEPKHAMRKMAVKIIPKQIYPALFPQLNIIERIAVIISENMDAPNIPIVMINLMRPIQDKLYSFLKVCDTSVVFCISIVILLYLRSGKYRWSAEIVGHCCPTFFLERCAEAHPMVCGGASPTLPCLFK